MNWRAADRVRQFLVAAARPGAVLEIDGSDHHYLVRVLRLRPGAVIPVADAAGRRGRATVTAVDNRRVRLLVAAERAATAEPAAAGSAGQRVQAGAAAMAGNAGDAAPPAGAGVAAPAGEAAAAAQDAQATGTGQTAQAAATAAAAQHALVAGSGQAAGAGQAVHAAAAGRRASAGRGRNAAAAANAGNAAQGAPAGPPRDTAPAGAPAVAGAPAAPPAVTLIQALPKGALMDRIVRQATELGAARIVPVVAERTQGRADAAAQARRRERWLRIARQAAQQSGAAPPVIEPPVPLRDYLEREPAAGLDLLCQPGGAALRAETAPGEAARARRPSRGDGAMQADSPAAVRCAVGPEGGFSPAEAALFRGHGFRAVGLPGGVLRVDTAAVAALTAAAQFLVSLHES